MREQYLYGKEMFDMPAQGCYCGVYMPTHVMKKIAKISAAAEVEIRKTLSEHKDELFVSEWTLANQMDGDKILKQIIVRYAVPGGDVQRRIDLFKARQPEHVKELYLVPDRETAKAIAEEILVEEIEKANGEE